MALEIGEPLPPRQFNWPSFVEALWRLGPPLLKSVPRELKPIIRLLREDPGTLEFDHHGTVWMTFREFWDDDPEMAVRETLQTWAEAVLETLFKFGSMECPDADEDDEEGLRDWDSVRPLVYKIKLRSDPKTIALLIDAATSPLPLNQGESSGSGST